MKKIAVLVLLLVTTCSLQANLVGSLRSLQEKLVALRDALGRSGGGQQKSGLSDEEIRERFVDPMYARFLEIEKILDSANIDDQRKLQLIIPIVNNLKALGPQAKRYEEKIQALMDVRVPDIIARIESFEAKVELAEKQRGKPRENQPMPFPSETRSSQQGNIDIKSPAKIKDDPELAKLLGRVTVNLGFLQTSYHSFKNNLQKFETFIQKRQNQQRFSDVPKEFEALLNFDLLNEDTIQEFSIAITDLVEYKKNHKISPEDGTTIKDYLSSISEGLYSIKTFMDDFWDKNYDSLNRMAWWYNQLTRQGSQRQEKSGDSWFLSMVVHPITNQTNKSMIRTAEGGWKMFSCESGSLNCDILEQAIRAFNTSN